MTFDKIDNYFIGLADRLTGRLDVMGIGLPVVLREILAIEMVVLVSMPFTAVAQGSIITAAVWTICMAVILPRRINSWKQYNRDAKAEWSEELSRRYFSRAERNRQLTTPRAMAWMFLFFVLSLVFWSISSGLYETTDTLLVAVFTIEIVKAYGELAHPRPPSKTARKQALSPA